ncbi:hypothetical protein CCMA1212_007354, partial [Trichoderma ghanense]
PPHTLRLGSTNHQRSSEYRLERSTLPSQGGDFDQRIGQQSAAPFGSHLLHGAGVPRYFAQRAALPDMRESVSHCTYSPKLLHYDCDLFLDGRTALSCLSKACRRLREIAQPVLCHCVQTTRAWHVLCSIIAQPDLAAHVRGLQYLRKDQVLKDLDFPAASKAHKELRRNRAAFSTWIRLVSYYT